MICRYFILSVLLLLMACQGKSGYLSEEKALELSKRAAVHFKLTTLPVDCLRFEKVEDPNYYIWVVREQSGGRCGAFSHRAPRKFTIRTHRDSGQMSTDGKNPGNRMEILE